MKTVIELKRFNGQESTQAGSTQIGGEDETMACLGKRTLQDLQDMGDGIFGDKTQKKIKNDDFAFTEYQGNANQQQMQQKVNFEDDTYSQKSYQELDDFYKLSALEDFKMTFNEL